MELEPATPEDLPALHALIERAYRGDSARQGWTHEADLLGGQRTDVDALAAMLTNPAQQLLLWRDGAQPAACVALTDKGDGLAYLGMLTVDPERQGGGTGRTLLAAAERWATDHLRARRIEMTVIWQRPELIAWYERRGYRFTGEHRPFPYGDERFGQPHRTDLEFVVLEKTL
ncbi:GNAT family N-acetyltransferase [Sphingomonas sp. BN140010]|uniref:GNAT family N-acetyltransferase n=1 Tax=Sphingomonas arvum TaxID=2992113 RepID=A0ABT3JF07_9SPHN|nr:GNAT family N-acetyltransferase [Sphingomonas sp. BN140010]MCW3797655.1 GNAT family N-acetyltransferase [Sphingomonas sp. BN140010]